MESTRMLIVINDFEPKAFEAALTLGAYFAQLGFDYDTIHSADLVDDTTLIAAPRPAIPDYAMAVVLGGDGTILRTATYLEGKDTPMLGINYGHLGFLTNPADDGAVAIVAAALAGDVTEQTRANLWVDVEFRDDTPAAPEGMTRRSGFFALNEVTVERGPSGHILDMKVLCNGQQAYNMRGNGAVVASATGSTAYALSAGGPLMAPGSRGMVVVPLAPHTLNSRAICTQPGEVVELVLTDNPYHADVTLYIDGRPLTFDAAVKSVRVHVRETPTKLLRYKYDGFYADISRVFFHEGGQE